MRRKMLAATAALFLSFAVMAGEPGALHSYLEVRLSPGGSRLATVEGDQSAAGGAPTMRDLVLRRADGTLVTSITLPCGRVAQCWPSAVAWAADSKSVASISG